MPKPKHEEFKLFAARIPTQLIKRIRVAALEQQVLQAKQQRDTDAANLNFAMQMREQVTQNLAPFNSNLTQSLASYRLP